jgi:cytochrome c553
VYGCSNRCVIMHPNMRKKWPILAVAVALGLHMPGALADVPAGEKKAELCVLCHRVDNSHGAPLLDGLPVDYLLKQFELFKSGKRFGPAMQVNLNPLSTEDLQDLADYFSSQPATRAATKITVDQQVQEFGSTVANDLRCAGCHGQDYRGTKDVPRLAGQLRNYLAFQMSKLQRDSSLHPPMSSSGQLIPQPAIEALATYLGSLEP